MTRPNIRCAIYTRKSSDDGLEQEFNSLDAQHEACAAYIASQRHEGWKVLPARYDDGGISGGTLERPGLKRLFAEIGAGRVDMVVVYKIDRLTRSLADFAKLVERLEQANCSFVSVTQAFNTSSSMGRLTLNVLLSFAQFEREVTAERIRDKIAASKKKGLWMGGLAPIGYDPHPDPNRRELIVNATEAETVRQVFKLYLQHGCLNATARAARDAGLRSKARIFASGRTQGGGPFSRGQVHKILINPVYRGLIRHKDKRWPGTHSAIVEEGLWEKVQDRLRAASGRRRGATGESGLGQSDAGSSALLLGKFRDETGDLLTPTHTQRHGRRLRYYISNRLVSRGKDPSGWRLPGPAFEQAVAEAVAEHLEARAEHHAILRDSMILHANEANARAATLASDLRLKGLVPIAPAILSGRIAADRLHVVLEADALAKKLECQSNDLNPSLLEIDVAFACRRRGVEMKIIAGERQSLQDPALVRALQNAHRWADLLKAGTGLRTIARQDQYSESYVARILPLATLSPRLQEAIVTGAQPVALTLETLVRTRIPLTWTDQERRFGMHA